MGGSPRDRIVESMEPMEGHGTLFGVPRLRGGDPNRLKAELQTRFHVLPPIPRSSMIPSEKRAGRPRSRPWPVLVALLDFS